jgi:DNA-binding FrmR family transcriptional regulator
LPAIPYLGILSNSNRAKGAKMPGYADNKERVTMRLRRIEGQVRGLQRMVDEDAYCIDVLTQVSAATRALQGVALELLSDHLSHCVQDALATGGPDAQGKVEEATAAIERLVRS